MPKWSGEEDLPLRRSFEVDRWERTRLRPHRKGAGCGWKTLGPGRRPTQWHPVRERAPKGGWHRRAGEPASWVRHRHYVQKGTPSITWCRRRKRERARLAPKWPLLVRPGGWPGLRDFYESPYTDRGWSLWRREPEITTIWVSSWRAVTTRRWKDSLLWWDASHKRLWKWVRRHGVDAIHESTWVGRFGRAPEEPREE